MIRRWVQRQTPWLVYTVCALLGVIAVVVTGGQIIWDGWLLDQTIAIRAKFISAEDERRVAVVALDHRSLNAPELQNQPRVFFAPHWAKMLDALFAADARAVGFDIVFAWSANAYRPNHDLPFFQALARHREKVVLARSIETDVMRSFAVPMRAFSDPTAIGFVELIPDPDLVLRRVPARIQGFAGPGPSLTAALIARAGLGPMPDTVLINPLRALEAIPTYSLIDVLRCTGNDPQTLARAFQDRIVLVGTTLPEEDRHIAPDRFLPPAEALKPESEARCGLYPLGSSAPGSGTVPGVHLHAAAVAAVVNGRLTETLPLGILIALSALLAAIAAWVGANLHPWQTVFAVAGLVILLIGAETAFLALNLWLPTALPTVCIFGSIVISYATRYLVTERRRRRIQRAFDHFLSPFLVERLAGEDIDLRLGGDPCEATIMFADLSGFTALSGKISAQELMTLTNRYLGFIVEAVEETGGYVDKFIGDCVMAIWGAPVPDPKDHAINGVRAALVAVKRIRREGAATAPGNPLFSVKIGLNSGLVVVGNVGTKNRYNYTAVGETVNIASRLESLPGDYGCYIVIGEDSARRLNGEFLLCELDRIRVKGRDKPLTVYEPITAEQRANAAQRDYVRGYAAALAAYRAGRFGEARNIWLALSYPGPTRPTSATGPTPTPPRVMAARAAAFEQEPPAQPWDGVWTKVSK